MTFRPPSTNMKSSPRTVLLLGAAILVTLSAWVLAFGGSPNPLRDAMAGRDWFTSIPFEEQTVGYVVIDTKITLSRDAHDADLLAIGDSSCQFGCVPEAFEREAGLRTVNLGTVGTAGPIAHAALLRAAFEAGSRPQAVLLWLHPSTLVDEASHDEYTAWLLRRLAGPDELGVSRVRAANDVVGGALRAEVIDFAGWKRTSIGTGLNPRVVRERLLETRGWFASPAQSSPRPHDIGELSDQTLAELEEVEILCRQYGADLYLYVMPRSTDLEVTPERWAVLRERIAGAVPTATVLPPRSESVDWRVMQSSAHYAADAARTHSTFVARELAALRR